MALSPELLSASSNLFCAEDADDVASWDDGGGGGGDGGGEWTLPVHSGDSPVAALLAAEPDHMPRADYLSRLHARFLDAIGRQDAINWILKVNEFYRFRPVTAYLSVNYLDRFLSANSLPATQGQSGQRSGWPMQLLSVACVSVAAKMEETHVPLLLDLQILDPRFVFEPRTVRRMELLLMAALRWRMRSVTPFDFLPHLAAVSLPSASSASTASLLSRAADLILSTLRVVDFLGYRPSAIAAAAILCAADEIADLPAGDNGDHSSRYQEWVSKEKVSGCRQLMVEYLIDTCPSASRAKPRREPPMPQSPVGVLDAAACGSCDTHKSSAAPLPELARAEPLPKRRRLGEGRCTESIDTGDDGGKNL